MGRRLFTSQQAERWTTHALVCLLAGAAVLWLAHLVAGTLAWPGRVLTAVAVAWLLVYWVAGEFGGT